MYAELVRDRADESLRTSGRLNIRALREVVPVQHRSVVGARLGALMAQRLIRPVMQTRPARTGGLVYERDGLYELTSKGRDAYEFSGVSS
jgi:hypothetical protein